MKVIAAILAIALMGAGLGHAEDSPGLHKRAIPIECDDTSCLVSIEDMAAIQRANANLAATTAALDKRLRELDAELTKLRDIKGCGKLEVQPKPPRALAPGERPA